VRQLSGFLLLQPCWRQCEHIESLTYHCKLLMTDARTMQTTPQQKMSQSGEGFKERTLIISNLSADFHKVGVIVL
jgi:hypothetical protein